MEDGFPFPSKDKGNPQTMYAFILRWVRQKCYKDRVKKAIQIDRKETQSHGVDKRQQRAR